MCHFKNSNMDLNIKFRANLFSSDKMHKICKVLGKLFLNEKIYAVHIGNGCVLVFL